MTDINNHNEFIEFGKHKGERWTRLPVSYLKWQWLSNETEGEPREYAEAELERRGTTDYGEVELSGHAIDRASQITNDWKDEGVHSWLLKITNEALEKIEDEDTEVVHNGYKFAFVHGRHYSTLKTIMKD